MFSISLCAPCVLKYLLESPPLFAGNSLFLGEGSFRLLEGFGADAIALPFSTRQRWSRLSFRYQGTVKIKRVALLSANDVYKELEYLCKKHICPNFSLSSPFNVAATEAGSTNTNQQARQLK